MRIQTRQFTSRRTRRGSALLLVLWLIGMLMMILYSTIRVVKLDMDLTIAQVQAFRCNLLCEQAINIATNPAVKRYDRESATGQPPLLHFAVKFAERGMPQQILDPAAFDSGEADGVVEVLMRSEGSRLNINTILAGGDMGKEFMTGLLEFFVGQVKPDMVNDPATKDAIDKLTDTMLDWVDTDNEARPNGMEKDDFEALGYHDRPFNRPFQELDELALIPGFDYLTSITPAWRDYFTVYSSGKLDFNDAKPEVIAAVMAATQDDPKAEFPVAYEDALRLDEHRRGPDGIADTQDDVKFQSLDEALGFFSDVIGSDNTLMVQFLFGLNDPTTHLEAVATVGEYRKRMVLILRGRDQGSPQIIFRKDIPIF